MNVFVARDGDDINGVFASLADALAAGAPDGVDEYVIGKSIRIRAFTETGELWWQEQGGHENREA